MITRGELVSVVIDSTHLLYFTIYDLIEYIQYTTTKVMIMQCLLSMIKIHLMLSKLCVELGDKINAMWHLNQAKLAIDKKNYMLDINDVTKTYSLLKLVG